jgi:ribonuclease P protein component
VNSGPAVSETFSRDDRLRKRREFEECYASGVRVSGRHIQVFLLADPPGSPPRPRLGISVPRRVGTAVVRNRVRRRIREIFRRSRGLFTGLSPTATRLVVNARPSSAGAEFSELLEDYRSTVTRALSRMHPPRK